MYSPFAPDCTSRVAWVPSLTNCNVAAGTAPPLGSVTVPRMRPPVLCASAKDAASSIVKTSDVANKMPREQNKRKKRVSTFMTSPLAAKNLSRTNSSWLLVPLKPYYNPVNLEKAGTSVKQKEFIRRIGEGPSPAPLAHQRSGPTGGHFFFRSARLGSLGPR